MIKNINQSDPQSGNGSKTDRLIYNKEMSSHNNVAIEGLCNKEEKSDPLMSITGIQNQIVLSGEIVQIAIEDIHIAEIHLKLYDSNQKRDKIDELKESISTIGQLEPIILASFLSQYYLLDGRLRLIAMIELGYKNISVIFSPSVNDMDTLDNLVMQYHIRKELTTSEKLNEIIEILQIGKQQLNKYIGIDKRRDMVSSKLGRGFSRTKVIELTEIIEFELENDFGHILSESIIEGKMKVSDGLRLKKTMKQVDYTSENESETNIIKGLLEKKYNADKANNLMSIYKGRKVSENPFDYPRKAGNHEIKKGNIFDVDLSNETFDVCFSSPPYAFQRVYGDNKIMEIGVEKNVNEYIKNIADAFEKVYNRLSETGSMFVNINDTWKDGFSLNVIERFVVEMENRGIRKVQMIHWEKPNPKPQGEKVHRYVNKFEYIIHFAKDKNYLWYPVGKVRKNLKVQSGCSEVGSKRKGYTLQSIVTASHNLMSENMIEGIDGLDVFTTAIKNNPMTLKRQFKEDEEKHTATFNMLLPLIPLLSTMPRDRQGIVIDPFAGTSTTGETALALGHKFVGVELYETNCKTSARILAQAEEMFRGINLMDELLENKIEYSKAA